MIQKKSVIFKGIYIFPAFLCVFKEFTYVLHFDVFELYRKTW